MKIKAYGYFNYANIHDRKEHLTLCPISKIESFSNRDYSGKTYEFETKENVKIKTETEKCYDEEITQDYAFINNVQVDITTKNGIAFLTACDSAIGEQLKIMLGNVKKAEIK